MFCLVYKRIGDAYQIPKKTAFTKVYKIKG